MNADRYALTVRSSFSAAHRLSEYEGNCERLHGHNWWNRENLIPGGWLSTFG